MAPPSKNAFQTRGGRLKSDPFQTLGEAHSAVTMPDSHCASSSHRNIRSVSSQISWRYSA